MKCEEPRWLRSAMEVKKDEDLKRGFQKMGFSKMPKNSKIQRNFQEDSKNQVWKSREVIF